jgi:hypothetical protein
MPDWNTILNDITDQISKADGKLEVSKALLPRLKDIAKITKRNVIFYYSAFLTKSPPSQLVTIHDADMTGFMTACHGLDHSKGLDLILHTPGGIVSATESIIYYLRRMFGTNIRVIVPHLAMSAGTMLAFSAKEIIMGKQSSLGPFGPIINGVPADGVLKEVEKIYKDVSEDPNRGFVWRPILEKYRPTFIGNCENACKMARDVSREVLITGMFSNERNVSHKLKKIINYFSSHIKTQTHDRHIPIDKCQELGLIVTALEDNQEFQDAILSFHHTIMILIDRSPVVKAIGNHAGKMFINNAPLPQMSPPKV